MKKILAALLITLILVMPVLACAENDPLTEAFLNGRALNTRLTFKAEEESLADLNGLALSSRLQLIPLLARFDIDYGEKHLSEFDFSYDEESENFYFKSAALGKTIGFSAQDLLNMAEEVLAALSSSDFVSEMEADAALERAVEAQIETTEFTFDLSELDYTPILLAILQLQSSGVSVIDVEDYQLNLRRLLPEGKETPAIDLEKNVTMYVMANLSQEDAQLLLNALMETITANPSLYAAIGGEIDSFTEAQEEFIERMVEDLGVMVGLDENGNPVYVTMTCALADEDGTSTSWMIEAAGEDSEDAFNGLLKVVYSHDEDDEWHELVTANGALVNGQGTFDLVITPNETDTFEMAIKLDVPEPTDTLAQFTLDTLLTLKDSEKTDQAGVVLNVKAETVGEADLACNANLAAYTLDGEAKKNLFEANLDMTTVDPIAFDASEAVYPIQMDEDEQLDLLGSMLDNAAEKIEEISKVFQPTEN